MVMKKGGLSAGMVMQLMTDRIDDTREDRDEAIPGKILFELIIHLAHDGF